MVLQLKKSSPVPLGRSVPRQATFAPPTVQIAPAPAAPPHHPSVHHLHRHHKPIAVCVSGEQRTLRAIANHTAATMVAPIRDESDVFMAISGLSVDVEQVARAAFQPLVQGERAATLARAPSRGSGIRRVLRVFGCSA